MPRARTTSQGPGVLAAVGRTAVVAVLAGLLTGLAVPGPATGPGEPTAPRGSAEGTSPAVFHAPATAGRASVDRAPAGPSEPARLGGAVTPRRYGLPTALAVVLVLGVASLQLRLLLAEPAARRAAPSSAPSSAPRPARERRHGVGSPRW